MENKQLEYLLNNYLAKACSAEEEKELFRILDSDEYDEQVKDYMSSAWNKMHSGHTISEEQSERILASIFAHQQTRVVPINSFRRKTKFVWAAASVIIIAAGITLFYLLNKPSTDKVSIANGQPSLKFKNDVLPGSTGAILKLADGSFIVLDSASDGNLTQQGNMLIIKNGGSLNYIQGNEKDKKETTYNTIETPRGRQYQLVLEDGTKVWLNAASSIRFPVIFDGDQRRVEITGEAYFEVAKNKEKPFLVAMNGTTVEVLGTHFNINSYSDEATINTTLLEGSVKIIKGNNQQFLVPGQQAQVNQAGDVRLEKNINVSEVMAWKDNLFSFNNTGIKKLMRQLSRWYDVDIVFKNEITELVTFNGDIPRTVNLSTVLKMLELTDEVNFSIEGKKITAELK